MSALSDTLVDRVIERAWNQGALDALDEEWEFFDTAAIQAALTSTPSGPGG